MTDGSRRGRVAVVGAGPGGLVTARYAVMYGLEPTVFEKADKVGGIFRGVDGLVRGYAWETMQTNMSNFGMHFLEFADTPGPYYPYRSQGEAYKYLRDYAHHFDLDKYIRLQEGVTAVQHEQGKWRVQTEKGEYEFDYLIVSTGKFSLPVMPHWENQEAFTGQILHSSQFSSLDVAATFGGKRVVIVGGSVSSGEMVQSVAPHAAKVTQVSRRLTYWHRRQIPSNLQEVDKSINRRSWDLVFFSRSLRTDLAEVLYPTPEYCAMLHGILAKVCADVIAHPAFDAAQADLRVPPNAWPSDEFADIIVKSHRSPADSKFVPIVGRSIQRFTPEGLLLDSGEEVQADIVLACTGYKANLNFLGKSILDIIEYDYEDNFHEQILYKQVFRPELPTLAFVGVSAQASWMFLEMQARWTTMTFAGIVPYPDAEKMRAGLEIERKMRAMQPHKVFAHDDIVGYSDSMAAEFGVLPDFERLKVTDPDLYQKLWYGPVIGEHYALFGPGSERTAEHARKLIDEAWQYMHTAD